MDQSSLPKDPSTECRDDLLCQIRRLEERCRRAEDALRTMEEKNRLLGDSTPFGILATDSDGRVFGANQKMVAMLGCSEQEDITRLNVLEHPPLVDSGVAEVFRQCIKNGMHATSDHACLQHTHTCTHLRYHISPVIDKAGRFSGFIAFVEDVTDLKRAEEAILASEKKYRLLFESAPVAMVERDAGELRGHLEQLRAAGVVDLGRYFDQHSQELFRCMELIKTVNCNSAFLDLMEAQTWDEIEHSFRMTYGSDDNKRLALEIIQMVADGNVTGEREATFVTLKGTRKRILGRSLPLFGHEGALSRIVVAMIDITQRKQAEEALRASEQHFRLQAMRDNLTGLYNRRYLYQSLPELIEQARINGSVVSVIFMDLDHFKAVVDTHGHLNGSRTIKEVAETIRETLTQPAYAVAYAGDEFVVVLPDHDPIQAMDQARKIQTRIKERVFLSTEGLAVRIRSSFGLAAFPDHAQDMTNLLAAADHALFRAKNTGKDNIRLFD